MSSPMGVKNIKAYLNRGRIFTRMRPTYIGRHEFNKRAENNTLKPASDLLLNFAAASGAKSATPGVASVLF